MLFYARRETGQLARIYPMRDGGTFEPLLPHGGSFHPRLGMGGLEPIEPYLGHPSKLCGPGTFGLGETRAAAIRQLYAVEADM